MHVTISSFYDVRVNDVTRTDYSINILLSAYYILDQNYWVDPLLPSQELEYVETRHEAGAEVRADVTPSLPG